MPMMNFVPMFDLENDVYPPAKGIKNSFEPIEESSDGRSVPRVLSRGLVRLFEPEDEASSRNEGSFGGGLAHEPLFDLRTISMHLKWALEYKYPCPEPIAALPRARYRRNASVVRVPGFESSCQGSNPPKANF
jgi:hypothetical protein